MTWTTAAKPKFLAGKVAAQGDVQLVNIAINTQVLKKLNKPLMSQEVSNKFYTLEISNVWARCC